MYVYVYIFRISFNKIIGKMDKFNQGIQNQNRNINFDIAQLLHIQNKTLKNKFLII